MHGKRSHNLAFISKLLDNFNECPNAVHSHRAQVRDMLNDFEQKNSGTKYSIVNSFLEILPSLKEKYKNAAIRVCARCSEPSSNEICSACNYVETLEIVNFSGHENPKIF